MITFEAALARVLSLCPILATETVPLAEASGRVLRDALRASRDQPPFSASAMDGYALAGPAAPGTRLDVIGEAAAGQAFADTVTSGQAVRIFTGAPVPHGADRVVIQEDVTRDGKGIILNAPPEEGANIRPQAIDFSSDLRVSAPRRIRPVDLALIAAMNHPRVTVSRRPDVAIIATGDELVMPGDTPDPAQIIASNAFTLRAMAKAEGATARLLPIARDTPEALSAVLELAADADMIVTIGGASVGTHDLVGPVIRSMGAKVDFHKIAIRPGKPLMAGTLAESVLLGLPGNPVSSIVCGHLFMLPALRAMMGLGSYPPATFEARLGCDLPANGPRAHYMRAQLAPSDEGLTITPLPNQDSALLTVLCDADALLIRPINHPPQQAGQRVRYLPI